MRGILAELFSARDQVNRKRRDDYDWDFRAPIVGKKFYTPRGLANVTAVSKCGERVLVFVPAKQKEYIVKPDKLRTTMIPKKKKPGQDNITLAVAGLDTNAYWMVCVENGIDYEKIQNLNPGMRKLALCNALKRRIQTHGSVFIVDEFHRSVYEVDPKSKQPRPIDPSRFGTREP